MENKYTPACCDGVSPLRRVAAIHDLSCFGRCALTVIIPTLSAMKNQVIPLPTCLLSSHTGGFDDLYFEDSTASMEEICAHFERLGLKFDSIYTGFLGSAAQLRLVEEFIKKFADKDTLVMVDPVMGDGGELYSTYTPELMSGMSGLCTHADIITPNLTEACFLTDTKYIDTSSMSKSELDEFATALLDKLSAFGAEKTVLTGLHYGNDKLCVYAKNNSNGEIFDYCFDRVNKIYPGTGDLFASVLLGSVLRGERFEHSVRLSCDFTRRVMEFSAHFNTQEREGVAFELFLGELSEI